MFPFDDVIMSTQLRIWSHKSRISRISYGVSGDSIFSIVDLDDEVLNAKPSAAT